MRYQTRPLGAWTDPITANRKPSYLFRAAWSDTLTLLGAETDKLGAQLVVLQVDATERDIRNDGLLRANARLTSPRVRISFESVHGPLTYATDSYDHWQANIRALALALQALRAVDRYGVTKRGEQYRGWLAIEAGSPVGLEEAPALLDSYGGERAAIKKTHPDHGGDQAAFLAVQRARDVLAGASS